MSDLMRICAACPSLCPGVSMSREPRAMFREIRAHLCEWLSALAIWRTFQDTHTHTWLVIIIQYGIIAGE